MRYGLRTVGSIKGMSLVLIVASILATFYTSEQAVHASSIDWHYEGATVEFIDDPLAGTPRMINHAQQCKMQKILVSNDINPVDSCVYQAKSFRFGWVGRYISGQDKSSLAISLGADQRFYMISNLNNTAWWDNAYWHASQESDDIVFSDGKVVMVFKDVPKSLDRDFGLGSISYKLRYPDKQYSFGNQGRHIGVAMSANGQWLIGSMVDYGLFRMRLSDGSVRLIADTTELRSMYHFSISNDGTSVAAGGTITSEGADITRHAKIFNIGANCGKESAKFWSKPSELAIGGSFVGCPYKSLNDILTAAEGYAHDGDFVTGIQFPKFNDSGDAIDVAHVHGLQSAGWLRVYKPGYTPPSRLGYIALGDSYSSGEGDIDRRPDGSSYYLPGTEGRDQCHTSSRSYPFLLRDYYAIPADKMKSIACSGAQVVFDYLPNMSEYTGQHQELASKTESDREQTRQAAIDSFIPGIVPQVEFVKRYKPIVVTFTGGGNDVGFANILAYCATPHWEELVLPGSITDCGYALPGSDLQKLLYDAIDTQYVYNKQFVNKLKEVSPDTKVVIVGYPSFISSDSVTCSLTFNSGALSQRERTAINSALSRMNTMLKRLAYDTDVSYIDIEDALNGGRMCEGSKYITGVTAAGYGSVIFEGNTQETFHPNALGHQKIAEIIQQSNVLVSDVAIDSVDYSPSESLTATLPATITEKGEIAVGSSVRISTSPFMFSPGSMVSLIGFSDKVELGVYMTDSEGALQQTVETALLPIGKHILLLEGVTFSGEPVKYYQFINIVDSHQEKVSVATKNDFYKEKTKEGSRRMYISNQEKLGLTSIHTLQSYENSSASNRNKHTEGSMMSSEAGVEKNFSNTSPGVAFMLLGGILLTGGGSYVYARQRRRTKSKISI